MFVRHYLNFSASLLAVKLSPGDDDDDDDGGGGVGGEGDPR